MGKIPEFKIRASASQQILGEKGLGLTGQGYIENWLKSHIYGHRKEFSNRYTRKGIACEEQGIDLVSSVYGKFLVKNDKPAENEFATGECDILTADTVEDIKNSWDCYTFPLFEKTVTNKTYISQAKTYLWLYDRPLFKLHYCLTDAPDEHVEAEYWRQHKYVYSLDTDEVNEDLYQSIKQRMTYSHIPEELRIKTYNIEREAKFEPLLTARVKDARNYILSLK